MVDAFGDAHDFGDVAGLGDGGHLEGGAPEGATEVEEGLHGVAHADPGVPRDLAVARAHLSPVVEETAVVALPDEILDQEAEQTLPEAAHLLADGGGEVGVPGLLPESLGGDGQLADARWPDMVRLGGGQRYAQCAHSRRVET